MASNTRTHLRPRRVHRDRRSMFSAGREFAAGTLRWWSSRLGRVEAAPRFVRVVPREAPVAARDLVVEVGRARIRVAPGFEPALLSAVVRALGEVER